MRHKDKEFEEARELRRQGASIRDISSRLSVAKSTVSVWVRDIELTEAQIAQLNDNARKAGVRGRERFASSMRLRRRIQLEQYKREAEAEYESLQYDPQFMLGLALYIGEGSKGDRSTLIVTNWNCRVIVRAIAFFERLGMSRERMRCKVMLHPSQDKEAAELFWSKATGIPLSQFANTYQAISPGSRGKRGQKWPHGGCQLSVSSFMLRCKINRWMELALETE